MKPKTSPCDWHRIGDKRNEAIDSHSSWTEAGVKTRPTSRSAGKWAYAIRQQARNNLCGRSHQRTRMVTTQYMYELNSKCDEVIEVDPAWKINYYDQLACAKCGRIPEGLRDHCRMVVLENDQCPPRGSVASLRGPSILSSLVCVDLVSSELADCLRLESHGFILGVVRHGSAESSTHRSCLASLSVGVPKRSDRQSLESQCSQCGCLLVSFDYHGRWLSSKEIAGRTIISGLSGTAITIAESIAGSLDQSRFPDLEFDRIEIRE